MQVLQVFLAGKGQKNLEIYQRKPIFEGTIGCYKTALYVHKEKHPARKNISCKFFGYDISFSNEYFCLSLCCTSTFFYGYDFPCLFQNYILLKLLTCYFVFEVIQVNVI